MNHESIREAADVLWSCWTGGRRIAQLPEGVRPQTRADGYAIQAHLEARTGRPLFGWKIAATSKAGQTHIAVDGPLAGRLLAERVGEDGGDVPFGAHSHMRVAEAEFAFRMGRDLPPSATPYSVVDVLDAVASLHPAIEIPDSRYDDYTLVGAPQLIADNACAHYFVLGPATEADWRALDLAAHPVVAHVGSHVREGVGANVLGDPRGALTWLANELSRLGITLRAGAVVTTGTCVVPPPIEAGDRIEMDFGTLGRVTARVASEPT
jgi:2-keto-4-pentenoate hydratase